VNERHASIVSSVAARQLLDVPPGASEQDLRRAFRQAVRAAHPDGGGTSGDLAALRRARDVLLQELRRNPASVGRERVFVSRRRPLVKAADRLLQRHRHAGRGASRKVL
jgi:curved DNA-binding protein CbpA